MDKNLEAPDWSTIPKPQDDGAAKHLWGARLPSVPLPSTDNSIVDLSTLSGRTVVYAYPRTGQPGKPSLEDWDMIPGARGCTPQSCSFRDHYAELKSLRVDHLFGLSTQNTAYQQEAAERLYLPFSVLSDEHLELAKALTLPTFEVSGLTLLKRLTLIIDDGRITHLFYPVFPPDRSASEVITWLSNQARFRSRA